MTLSLELILDARLDRAVMDEWEALESCGHSSLAAHRSASNRPHITLAEDVDRAEVDAIDWDRLELPLAVTLGAPLLFGTGDRRVLARSVVPSESLLRLHGAIHSGLSRSGGRSRPGAWTPHVSLARRLKVDSLADALVLVGGELAGTAVAVRSWDSDERVVRMRAGRPAVSTE